LTLVCSLLGPALAIAEVVAVHVTSREVVAADPRHGQAGAYEVLKGTIDLEVDPDNPANGLVVDLHLAPAHLGRFPGAAGGQPGHLDGQTDQTALSLDRADRGAA
jgi:hypothetical protein